MRGFWPPTINKNKTLRNTKKETTQLYGRFVQSRNENTNLPHNFLSLMHPLNNKRLTNMGKMLTS